MLSSVTAPANLESIRARFATHVNAGPHPDGSLAARHGCHVWTGAVSDRGYGIFGWSKGRTMRAHRAAYELAHGDPGPSKVLHRCDNPPCVNPDHLHTGTQAQNNADRQIKGRWAGGREAKLTDEQKATVARRAAMGESKASIALAFGCSRTTVRNAIDESKRGTRHG